MQNERQKAKIQIKHKIISNLNKKINLFFESSAHHFELAFQSKTPLEIESTYNSEYNFCSKNPLTLPAANHQLAKIETQDISGAQPNTEYDFPHLNIEIYYDSNHLLTRKHIEPSSFKTYAQGKSHHQVLEHLAVILDFELQELGFRVLRKQSKLVFQGLPEFSGLNLKILTEGEHPDFNWGLATEVSSFDHDQTQGFTGFYDLGNYLVHRSKLELLIDCQLCPSLKALKEQVLGRLSPILSPLNYKANFNPTHHLEIKSLNHSQGKPLSIHRVPSKNNEHYLIPVPWELPIGQLKPVSDGLNTPIDLGSFSLQNQPINLGHIQPREYNSYQLKSLIIQSIESQVNHIKVSFDSNHKIKISSQDQYQDFILNSILDSNNQAYLSPHPLGLKETHIQFNQSGWPKFEALFQNWATLYSELLNLLEAENQIQLQTQLKTAYKQEPSLFSPLNPVYINLNDFKLYFHTNLSQKILKSQPLKLKSNLVTLMRILDDLLEVAEPVSAPMIQPSQDTEKIKALSPAVRTKEAPNNKKEERKPPSFDHKI